MIFVAGCARSGTTFTMSALRACGVKLGNVDQLNELPRLKKEIVRPYLEDVAGDATGQWRLPTHMDLKEVPGFREKVLEASEGAEAIKIVSGILLWPLWVSHFPEAKWLLIFRDPARIADSCMRANFLNAYNTPQEWESWARQYQRRLSLASQVVPHRWLSPGSTIAGDMAQMEEAVSWLGHKFNADAVRQVIKPGRWGG